MKPRFLIGYSACPLTLAAFEAAGVDVWTCDLLPSRGRPDRHLQCDVWEVARDRWTAALFHPMCTYLTVSAAWAFADPDFARYPGKGYHQRVKPGTLTGAARREKREEELANFRRLLELPYPKAIENPAPSFVSDAIRPPDQTIHPHQFGDDASKRTGLWLDRLPRIRPTAPISLVIRLWRAGAIKPMPGKIAFLPVRIGGLSAARLIRALRRPWARNGEHTSLALADERHLQLYRLTVF